jgi:glycosyltransferase involved in cell wall biosynthesis
VPFDRHFGNIKLYRNTRKRLCNKIKEIQPDLVHTHMFGYYTLAALDSRHRRVVVSTHGVSYRYWDPVSSIVEKVRRYSQDYIYIKCEKETHDIIVNSPFVENLLSKYKDKKIYRLNNPVSETFFDRDTNAEEEKRLLFVGNICEAKGVMTMLYAFERVRESMDDVRLFIAGQVVENNYYHKLVQFIKEKGLEKSVYFLGHLCERDLKEQYRKASIFIFPSHQDIAPLAVLQAMALAKAVIATDVGGIPYIIDDGLNGILIQKEDYKALAEKVSLLIRDAGLRRRLGFNAQKKISDDYRINTVGDKLYRIYTEVLST